MRVEWVDGNIFTSYDQPGKILIDTEGKTVRLHVYIVVGDNTIIYIDDTASGTNRSGMQVIQLFSDTGLGEPPSDRVDVYNLIVDIYDENNNYIETRTLRFAYTRYNMKTIRVLNESNRELVVRYAYTLKYGSDAFFASGVGSVISIPVVGELTRLELLSVEGSKKYYALIDVSTLPTPGAIVVLKPSDHYTIYIEYTLTNQVLNTILGLPVVNWIIWALAKGGEYTVNAGLYIAAKISDLLGIKHQIVKVEVVSTNPFTIRVYYDVDPVPTLVIVAGIVVAGAIIAWMASNIVTQIKQTDTTYNIMNATTQMYNQYMSTVNSILQYAKERNLTSDELKNLLTSVSTPNVPLSTAGNIISSQNNTIEELKNMLYIAIGGAIVITVLTLARR